MHKLNDDTLVTPNLLRKMNQYAHEEGGDGQHYAVLQRDDRSFLSHNPMGPELDGLQMMFAQDLLTRLNDELHHDGAWLIMFDHPGQMKHLMERTNEYSRFILLWIDKDGDNHVYIDWVAGEADELLEFSDVLMNGPDLWLDMAEQAWQSYDIMLRQMLELKPGQTYKKALGERAPSGNPNSIH